MIVAHKENSSFFRLLFSQLPRVSGFFRTKMKIQKFIFQQAKYFVSNGVDEVFLDVDYKNNSYTIEGNTKVKAFEKELDGIARELLIKKHNTNFADKFNK